MRQLEDDLSQWAMELPIDYKVPDKTTTKKILRDAFAEDFENVGLEWITTRLKVGMPYAVANLDTEVLKKVDQAISDIDVRRHPLGGILDSKMNLLVFDIFEHIFFKGWDHHGIPPEDSLLARLWPE